MKKNAQNQLAVEAVPAVTVYEKNPVQEIDKEIRQDRPTEYAEFLKNNRL